MVYLTDLSRGERTMVERKDFFFISYTGSDRAWAGWIRQELENAGYATISYERDFPPGHSFMEEIERAFQNCERMLALVSPRYLQSKHCMWEWQSGLRIAIEERPGYLLPIVVQACDLPAHGAHINSLMLHQCEPEEAQNQLLAFVGKPGQDPQEKVPFPGEGVPAQLPDRGHALRFPGELPRIWNVPYLRNPYFTGRDGELQELAQGLDSGRPAAVTQAIHGQAIHGLGGIGKTQLALEYCYRYQDKYDLVWWIPSGEATTMASVYAKLAEGLDLPEKNLQEIPLQVAAVKRSLGHRQHWLLVFDNANGPEELYDVLPQAGKGHVLITSRHPDWDELAAELSLQVFTREEAVEFLSRRVKKDDGSVEKLAEELGFLPLALEHAAAYMKTTEKSPGAYLDLFRGHGTRMFKEVRKPLAYPESLATTWDLSMQRAVKESAGSALIMNFIAFLAPDNIPISVLKNVGNHSESTICAQWKEHLGDDLAFEAALRVLRQYSLIRRSAETLSVHRLVQLVTRDRLGEEQEKKWAEAAVEVMNGSFPFDQSDPKTWQPSAELLDHAVEACNHAERLNVVPHLTGELLNKAGHCMQHRAGFKAAEAVHRRALEILRKGVGEDHTDYATSLNNLASVLWSMGDLEEAKEKNEQALKIQRKTLGEEHPSIAFPLDNLGTVLHDMGKLEEAKSMHEQALEIRRRTLGDEHPDVANSLNNLAEVLRNMGELEEAKSMHEQALKIRRKTLGEEHPSIAFPLDNLGAVLQDMGELEEAKEKHEQALKIRRRALGDEHPDVATSLNNLGSVLYHLGDHAEAKELMRKALRIWEKALGPDHPNTKTARGNLEFFENSD